MSGPIEERDWKYLRSIHDEMLHALCARINGKAVEIVTGEGANPREQYLRLYRHIQESDGIVGECFNDWRRSTISGKITRLRHHGLFLDEHVEHLSESAQDWLAKVEELESGD